MDDVFSNDIKINKYRLDDECISHTSRYAYYSEASVLAKSEVTKAKDKLEYVLAERNLELRKEFSEQGVKVTEAVISSALAIDSSVLKAKSELREAEEVFAKLQVAVSAMETRRSELDNLVKLYVSGYFSTTSGETSKKTITDAVSSDIRKNLNRRKNND